MQLLEDKREEAGLMFVEMGEEAEVGAEDADLTLQQKASGGRSRWNKVGISMDQWLASTRG